MRMPTDEITIMYTDVRHADDIGGPDPLYNHMDEVPSIWSISEIKAHFVAVAMEAYEGVVIDCVIWKKITYPVLPEDNRYLLIDDDGVFDGIWMRVEY